MREIKYIWLLVLLVLAGCTSDEVGPERKDTPIQIVGYVPSYMDPPTPFRGRNYSHLSPVTCQLSTANSLTRTEWTPPEGYSLYTGNENGTTALGAFFTSGTESDKRRIYYHTVENKWYIEGESPSGSKYLYGYIPYNAADVTIAPNGIDYSNGATLTFNNMKSVMTTDACVIVGAKEGANANTTPEGLQPGKFYTNLTANNNHLYLLCEHLYSKLEFCFRVGAEYAALRTIKLRKVELIGYTYTLDNLSDKTPMKEKGSLTVTLTANDQGISPLGEDVILFTPNESSAVMPPILLFEGEEALPSDTYTSETAYVPYFNLSGSGKVLYILRTTYDVYDTKGNLIRKGCVAENQIVPKERFSKNQLQRGYKYTLQLTVVPTYLYVLSEPDLDNPTVTLE